ncbi:dephospho-CoA kinase [Dictyoglomus thermophilum]|uniref:Dephospho-CoA kinase n=2 Tax=Dictyoglomus thermophilum TaxID=14 RepID=B5YDJ1_DICT6|nr:dephospho-CoA kinase [Dictyoglomus thermophilum]ACI19583.1 dephospho-CoA kinase [Dictyoglomus thermophilum H-6-12]MCX7721273.1 dephospho-CoA kinase [Dictyoglomus thermophilum]TYT22872.1 dephospho-CoA kinase [Dictyoglomus thermophilum]
MSYKIGITGGIGTGKSLVSNILKELGIIVISADEIVRELQKDPYYLQKIREIFGDNVFDKGNLDRKKLAKIIFSDSDARRKLENLLHPPVLEEIKKKLEELKERDIIAVEVPLLFEVGIEDWFDEIWVVYAPFELQLERIVNRDNISKEDAVARIRAQIPIEEKLKKADFVIYNDKDIESTKNQIKERVSTIYRMIYNKNLE